MLTLFPRIRPNPLPPPPKLPEEAPAVANTDAALSSESAEAGAKSSGVPAVETIAASPRASVEASQPASAAVILAADSDSAECASAPAESRSLTPELSVLVASLANAGGEPFVVELTDRWVNPAPEDEASTPVHELENAGTDLSAAAETLESARLVTEAAPEGAGEPSSALAATEPAAAGGVGDAAPAQPQNLDPPLDATAEPPLLSAAAGSAELWIAGTNIFDELDILHEAAAVSVASAEIEPPHAVAATEPPVHAVATSSESTDAPIAQEQLSEPQPATEAATLELENGEPLSAGVSAITASTVEEAVSQSAEPPPALEEPAPSTEEPPQPSAQAVAVGIAPIEDVQLPESVEAFVQDAAPEPHEAPPSISEETVPDAEGSQAAEPVLAAETVPASDARLPQAEPAEAVTPESAAEPQAQGEQAQGVVPAAPVNETLAADATAEPAPQPDAEAASAEAAVTVKASPAPRAAPAAIPPKPKHAQGRFFELARVPEPEVMDDSGEVEAYASAAAQAHLDAIDDTFVAHAQLLLKGRERGRALDIGTGPGQILIKLASKLTRWKFVGVDRSTAMIDRAREAQAGVPEVAGRVEFRVADGNSLDFPDATFDLVVCNSVLHHVAEPQNLFSEIARLVKPGGAILLRDLRRPARFEYGSHIRKHGKHYSGEMRRLFVASVQAAYTEEELQKMVAGSKLRDVHVFAHGKTHIGFERSLAETLPEKSKSAAR